MSEEVDDPVESCRLAAAALRSAARTDNLRVTVPLRELLEIAEHVSSILNSLHHLAIDLSEQSLYRDNAIGREHHGTESPMTQAIAAVAGLHAALVEASIHASQFHSALVHTHPFDGDEEKRP